MSENINISVTLRLATIKDISINKTPIYGVHYYVLNQDGKTFSGVHTITDETNFKEMNSWFSQDRLYVQESCLDKEIKLIKP